MEDKTRYTDLVSRYGRAIRSLCRVRARGDNDRCDDLVQDVMLSLWEHFGKLRSDASPQEERAWVMWHTRTVLDHLHRKPVVPTEPLSHEMADTIANDELSESEILQGLMADLDENDRQFIQMYLDGYSGEEIAEQMGVSRDAVYKRKQRLLARMRVVIILIIIILASVGAVAELADWEHFRLFHIGRNHSEKSELKPQKTRPKVDAETLTSAVSVEHLKDSSTISKSGWAFSVNTEDRTVTYIRYANGKTVRAVMHNAPDVLFENDNCLISDTMNNTLKQAALTATLAVLATATKAQVAHDFQSISPQGDTLYYNIVDSAAHCVSVFGDEVVTMAHYIHYSDTLVIPSTVEYDGTIYAVTSLADNAFRSHSEINAAVIPSTVTSIGTKALSNTGIFELTVPDGIDTIRANAFQRISNVIYHGSATGSPWGAKTVNGYEEDGIFYSDSSRTYLTACRPGRTSVTVPQSVRVIGPRAFEKQTELASVTLLEGLDTIERYAFDYCSSLGSITIPSTVSMIGKYAFSDAFKADGSAVMTIADAPVSIGNNAFAYSNLGAIDLGGRTHTIGERAFVRCEKLDSIIIPPSVTYIGPGAFCYVYNGRLKKVTLPEGIDTIRFETFHGCIKLQEVNIPSTVVYIDTMAFTECFKIKHWTLPAGLVGIGQYAFSSCTGTETITSYAVVPPVFEADAFESMNLGGITLTVPCGSKNAYLNSNWNVFGTINEDCGRIESSASDDCIIGTSKGEIHIRVSSTAKANVYDALGRLITSRQCTDDCTLPVPQAGIYLVQCGNHPARKVVVP